MDAQYTLAEKLPESVTELVHFGGKTAPPDLPDLRKAFCPVPEIQKQG